ncbi:NAD(P)H-dependent D-xylose reductase (XR) [Ceratobasidium sp. 428]|nr:NAD(P)H-dependent D-xylose reductase (XR) [Ceratobasidium sp. 428]
MASITLKRTGQKMPLVGFGLWKVTKSTCADTVYNAIKSGYRLLDGAGDYGNEKQAGEGVARAIKDGLVKREDLFITSKLWNTFHAKEHVPVLAKKQLADWGLDYFDLFLIHFPISLKYVDPAKRYPPEWFSDDGKTVELQNSPIQETWVEMEKLVDAGSVKNIGVSNMQGALIIDIFRYARIPPQVLQIEHHPYLTQEPLVKLANTLGLAVTAYSSFGPQSFLELNMGQGVKSLLEGHDVIQSVASAHKKTPAQILLRWASQRGIAVIPKSNNQGRLEQNLASTDFDLTEEQIKSISALNQGIRFNNPADIDPRMAIFA